MEIEEARELILEKIKNTEGTEIKALEDSFGYVLAQDITSKRDIPSFPRSAMDGYAVHSDDIKGANRDNPVRLTVTEELCAGDVPDKSKDHGPGTTVRIMTGAYIPEAYNLDGTKFDVSKFGRRIAHINHTLFGVYNEEDANAANRVALGRLLMQYRKWMKPLFNRRFQKYVDKKKEREVPSSGETQPNNQ